MTPGSCEPIYQISFRTILVPDPSFPARVLKSIYPLIVFRTSRVRVTLALMSCLFLFRLSTAQQNSTSLPDSAVPGESAVTAGFVQSQMPESGASSAQIDELIRECNEQMNAIGQFQRAGELAEQAVDLSLKTGDKARGARAMIYQAAAYAYQGRLAEAYEVSRKNIALARETGDRKLLTDVLSTAAGVAEESGRSEESLADLYESLDVAREIGDITAEYVALLNIGDLYVRVGDPDKGEAPLLESLKIGRGIKHSDIVRNPSKKAAEMALASLGAMEIARRHYPAALNYYKQVYASRPESPLWVITALEGMAEACQQLGEPQKAVRYLQEAIPLAEKASAGLPYAKIISDLGYSQESLGKLNEALESQNRALDLVHRLGGSPDYEWQFESRLGHVYRALDRNKEALAHYKKSIAGIERLRSGTLDTEAGRAGILERSRTTYAETADLLYELHQGEEALAIAERGRARAFLDVLAQSRAGVGVDDLTPEQRRREGAILARISRAQENLWKESTQPEDAKNKAALTAAEDDLDGFHAEIRQTNPRYASVHYPNPSSVREIQNNLLDDRTALVEYLLGEKRSLVWVVTKQGIITSVLASQKEIEDSVNRYRKLLAKPASALTIQRSLAEINRRGAMLYNSVFEPIANAVRDRRTLIIIPDGGLDYLPFEALVCHLAHFAPPEIRTFFLAEKFAFVYGPSASALATVQELNGDAAIPPKMLLAFGAPAMQPSSDTISVGLSNQINGVQSRQHPPSVAREYAERGFPVAQLPYARDEILAISKLFPASQSRIYIGPEARKDKLKSEKLNQFRYIHFASHGFLDEVRPERSGVMLARGPDSQEDGVLRVDEIMRLRLNADLVTLSACSTGLGKLVNGEGILGLARAFFYAGARNVAMSLWNVNDSATSFFMEAFYRNLKGGMAKAEALRQTELEFIRNPHSLWAHPYFWAGFVIEGEGR
jgi:CHAT domain-containing protein